jgi:hypothetical protein
MRRHCLLTWERATNKPFCINNSVFHSSHLYLSTHATGAEVKKNLKQQDNPRSEIIYVLEGFPFLVSHSLSFESRAVRVSAVYDATLTL